MYDPMGTDKEGYEIAFIICGSEAYDAAGRVQLKMEKVKFVKVFLRSRDSNF